MPSANVPDGRACRAAAHQGPPPVAMAPGAAVQGAAPPRAGDTSTTRSDGTRLLAAIRCRNGGFVVILAFALLFLAASGRTEISTEYLERSATRALESFAVSRGINAVISVLQEVEPGFSLGVSVSFKPGQILDPVNDLVERFSTVMLAVTAILWALRLLAEIAATPVVVGGVAVAALACWLASASRSGAVRRVVDTVWRGVVMAVALITYLLAIPLVSEAIHHTDAVSTHYNGAVAEFRAAHGGLEALRLDRSSLQQRLEDYTVEAKRLANELTRQVVVQIAVYLLETVLVPLAGLWVVIRVGSGQRNSGGAHRSNPLPSG